MSTKNTSPSIAWLRYTEDRRRTKQENLNKAIKLFEEGYRNWQIAKKLGLTAHTIRNYRREYLVNFEKQEIGG